MKLVLRRWQIAYRIKPSGSIFTDLNTPFIAIPNTLRYMAADPFLFTENGKTYLFAELQDSHDNLGKIGYAEFDGEKFGDWKVVISENYHLSYPNIFRYKGNIYIVPESSASKQLYAYKAVSFPDKWEKCGVLLDNIPVVDTTFTDYEGKHLMFTYDITDYENGKLWLYEVGDNGKAELYCDEPISEDVSVARHGGNFLNYEGKLLRVAQDCDGDYGKALVFLDVKSLERNGYSEEIFKRIEPVEVTINKDKVTGLHTYNADENIEVIDFHVPDYFHSFSPGRVIHKIKKRLG